MLISNRAPGEKNVFEAREIIDAGFLELVRYGIRRPDDPLIVDSLKVVDHVLKIETPNGACWRRYNHDGYGQRKDGGPYMGWGQGRAWPLLGGERGHYELAAGARCEAVYSRYGEVQLEGRDAAGTDLGSRGRSAGGDVLWAVGGFGAAAGVGALGVSEAAAEHGGRTGI